MARSARRFAAGVPVALLLACAAGASAQPVAPTPVPGRNVNLSSGPAELNTTVTPPIVRGDFLLKQQNEGSCAMSSRNPKNILCGANDYRLIDVPGVDPNEVTRDAWGGVFQSANYGDTWESTVLPGHYLDPAPSLLKSYKAMADPVVRSGAAGLTYMSGIAFKGPDSSSIVYLATFLDLNNKENDPTPFKLVRLTQVDWGPDGQFIDKPWQVVLPPEGTATCTITLPDPLHAGQTLTQTIPDSPVIIGYSIFVGHQANTYRTKQMIARVTNCGANVGRRVKISESQKINQAMALAASPTNPRKIVAVWRRFAEGAETNALLSSVSADGGVTWMKPAVSAPLALICPFDQNATATKFRTQSFPAVAAGPDGKFYVAWADRGKDSTGACQPSGASRIMLSWSTDGLNWSAPAVVEEVGYRAHQVNPSLTVGGNTLHLLWQDMRDSASGYFVDPKINELPLLQAAAGLIPFPDALKPVKHNTIEVYSKMAILDGGPLKWGASVAVTQYKTGAYKDKAGVFHYGKVQWNMPNLRLFARGTKAFDGDYLDAATPPMLPPEGPGSSWRYNTGQGDPYFFGVWTDNRDVRRSPAQSSDDETQATPYTPVGRTGTSLADPTQQCPVCVPGTNDYAGTMNQNLYGARINRGFVAYAPGNNKRIHYSNKFNQEFQRAYVVMVRNDSSTTKAFHLTIPPEYQAFTGGYSSFTQFEPVVTQLLVTVPKHSSASRTVFITPDHDPATTVPANTKVRVDVSEVVGDVELPLGASVYINPDPTAPEVEAPEVEAPEVEAEEVYAPEVEAPEVEAPEVEAPEVEAPEVEAPEVEAPEVEAPEVEATSYMSPEVEAPEVEAPEVEAPEVEAPEVEAAAITDIVWPLKNGGNTTAAYIVRPTVTGNLAGYDFQLIVSRIIKTPTAQNCQAAESTMNRVAVLVDANRLVDPNQTILPEDVDYATAWVNPRAERVLVTLRVRTRPGFPTFVPQEHETALAVTPEAVDTESVIVDHDTTPDTVIVTVVPTVEFGAMPLSATSTRPIAPAVTATVADQFGAPMPGVSVSMALGSAPTGAALGGTTTAITDALGNATFSNLVITGAGEQFTLVASAVDALPVESAAFMVFAACAADGAPSFATTNIEGPDAFTKPLFIRDANFDGDAYRDIVVLHENGVITKASGTGRGLFNRRFQFMSGGGTPPTALAVADVNEDGLDDFVATFINTNHDVRYVLSDKNNSGQYFTKLPVVSVVPLWMGGPSGVATGDFNGDGHVDVAVSMRDLAGVALLAGDGSGALTVGGTVMYTQAEDGPQGIVAARMNVDAALDLVTANPSSATMTVLIGDGAGGFAKSEPYDTGRRAVAIAAGDIDRDGDQDVIFVNTGDIGGTLPGDVRVLFGDGTGTLTLSPEPLGTLTGVPSSVTLGDWNADGWLDIAVANHSTVEILFSNGTGGFATPRAFTAGNEPVDVWAAEVTGHTPIDLLVANRQQTGVFDTISTMIGTCGERTADLESVMTESADPVLSGSSVNYTVTVTNHGPFPATNAIVAPGFIGTFDALNVISGTCTGSAPGVQCSLGTVAVGDSVSVEVQLTNVMPTSIRGYATAVSDEVDPDASNSRGLQTTTVTATPLNFVVTNANDNGAGSLRQAITNANVNSPATDTITFAIPGAGLHTITPVTSLPSITDSAVLDATTQLGYAGVPVIELSGATAGGAGLRVAAANTTVRGFTINGFSGEGVSVTAPGAVIVGNYLGTDVTGTSAVPNQNGVAITSPGTATIGGGSPADRNVLSGNRMHGIQFSGSAGNSTIQGNYIGTNAAGTAAVPNSGNGITMYGGGSNLVINNVISGNAVSGVAAYSPSIRVQGNYIGTNAIGTAAIPNGSGVTVCYSATANIIGGTTAGERNIISGNTRDGVTICASNNTIAGNYIGISAAGTAALPNQQSGIAVQSGASNTIGGTTTSTRNVISGNTAAGIAIVNPASGIVVMGNFIGTNASGTIAVANGYSGVSIASSSNNTIGGSAPGAGNLISGNQPNSGVTITGTTSADNVIEGNVIGTDATGATALANAHGISLSSPQRTRIRGNVISGNTAHGIYVAYGTRDTEIMGNRIGVNLAGTAAIANGYSGIFANDAVVVGGAAAPDRNIISGNTQAGIRLGADGNSVMGNFIGTDATGTAAVPNDEGIHAQWGGNSSIVGNVISGNASDGLALFSPSNQVRGNYIGTDPSGFLAVPNGGSGVFICSTDTYSVPFGQNNTIGGTIAAHRNIISGNGGPGVDVCAGPNTIAGNFIGLNAAGSAFLPNSVGVLVGATRAYYPPFGAGSLIGGTIAEAGNIISGNTGDGIRLVDARSLDTVIRRNTIESNGGNGITVSNTIRVQYTENNISNNGGLGIDLDGDGVTPNEGAPDADSGTNNLQDYPGLTSAVGDGSSTAFTFILSSTPNSVFSVDLYDNDSCEPSGFGEGQRWISRYGNIATDGTGLLLFSDTQGVGVPIGHFITATATDAAGNTSEFSACLRVEASGPTGIGSAQPASNARSVAFHLITAVTPAGFPPSTGLTVTVDATAIGGSAAMPLYDLGMTGGDGCDDIAGDSTFIACAHIAASVPSGVKVLPVTIADAQGRTGTTTISVNVENSGTTGRIQGIVMDGTGAPLPGVIVSIRNQATMVVYSVVTNATGNFVFLALTPGNYRVMPAGPDLTLEAGQTLGATIIQ